MLAGTAPDADAERLVILHTNDTHSQIDPDAKGLGGIGRRKAVIDSVRAAEPNVMLVDAGDAVQGTLYFSLFGGEVEQKMMNRLGYDIQILGNHEFDNGMEALGNYLKGVKADKLTSNYRLDGTPLEGLFKPYTIRRIGNKKVGFLALNLIPTGMIDPAKSTGVRCLDALDAANAYAWVLRNMEGCDMVVALTHIGYEDEPGYSDVDIARGSRDIDVIIGGHSHTRINPAEAKSLPWRVANQRGDSVLIAQTGRGGAYIGEIDLDLDNRKSDYSLIKIDSRLDSRLDPSIAEALAPYRHKVDSVMNIRIGMAGGEFRPESGLLNLISDAVLTVGTRLDGGRRPDLAIMNKGGLRTSLAKGPVTKGEIMQVMPFDNHVVVIELKGDELLKAFDVMASRGGDGVSGNVSAIYNPTTKKCSEVKINGKSIDPERTYTLATINYLADGGDYMAPLKHGKRLAESDNVIYDDIIELFTSGALRKASSRVDNTPRMRSSR